MNYNLGRMTDKLFEELHLCIDSDTNVIVLDASDKLSGLSIFANKRIEDDYYGENFRKELEIQVAKNEYDWYIMMSNDIYNLPKMNWIRNLTDLANRQNAVIVTPHINKEGTSHRVMHRHNDVYGFRYVNWIDFQTPIIHHSIMKEALKKWDNTLKYGWGIDSLFGIECYNRGLNIIISDEIGVCHYDKKTFKENEDKLSLQQYRQRAMTGERVFLIKHYGEALYNDWIRNLRTMESK